MAKHKDLDTFIGSGELLDVYAELKSASNARKGKGKVTVADVLRHAAKDFVQGAYGETPEAPRQAQNPWALVPGHGSRAGKGVYLYLPHLDTRAQRRLEPFRLRKTMRGFALAAFIPVWRQLIPDKRPSQAANFDSVQRGWSLFARKSNPYHDRFKADVEAFRQAHMTHNSPDDFSATETFGEGTPATEISVQVTERALTSSATANWEEKAQGAGYRLASLRLLGDLHRLLSERGAPA